MSSSPFSNTVAPAKISVVAGGQQSNEGLVIIHVVTQLCLGGAENHVAQLAAAQVADGHKVTVIGLWPGEVSPQKFADGLRESGVGYAIVHSGHRFLRPLAMKGLGRLLAKHNPDVIHSHLPAASIAVGWWHRSVSRHRHPRMVATIHGWANRASFGWRRRLYIWALQHHDEVIAVSRWLADRAINFGLVPRSVHVVHHGIRQPSVNPANHNAIRTFIEDHFGVPDARVIGSIARHTATKRLELLIGAVPLMDPRNVVVIIGAEADSTPALRARVTELGIAERCWFVGTTSEPADWLAAFDVFCLPSHLEGFGLVFLEAGLIGIPVVGADAPATNEIIRTGVDGILVSDIDSASLANAISQILDSPALAQHYVETFRDRVLTNFSFRTMVDATYKTYSRKAAGIS